MTPRSNRRTYQYIGCPIFATAPSSLRWVSRESATAFFSLNPTLQRTNEEPTVPALRPIQPILPEGEAILQPPMDNTPNEAPTSEVPSRVPHFGHAFLFLSLTGAILLLIQVLFLGLYHSHGTPLSAANIPPKLIIASEAFTYLATLAISWLLFPLL